MKRYPLVATFCLSMMLAMLGGATHARPDEETSRLCELAAEQVAAETNVPVSVLKAISLNETGRKLNGAFRPWAWTVNMEGTGHWFDSIDEARAYVFGEFKRGARSFDIGCFQINYKWHGQAFSSIDEMFDPVSNGRYAAQFLSTLFQETGSWKAAAGAYHSRTESFAERYAERFASIRKRFLREDATPNGTQAPDALRAAIPEIPDIVATASQRGSVLPRRNTYPLLMRKETSGADTGTASGASLFAAALLKIEGR